MEDQEKVWDALAEQWYHFRHQQFRDVRAEIGDISNLKPGKILEIGCGNCRNLIGFAKSGFDCYGIDFSKNMLKYAREYCKKYDFKVKLKKARAEKLPFKKESFDYVLSIATLHHLKRDEQELAVKEMRRVLKPKGIALITVWNKGIRSLFVKEKYMTWTVKGKAYWRYYYLFTPFELKRLLKKRGFGIIMCGRGKNIIVVARKK
jgi:ubiquinone/menaquinone biosynthesis C-methylase UbiE